MQKTYEALTYAIEAALVLLAAGGLWDLAIWLYR
jgi:hypothetical protein